MSATHQSRLDREFTEASKVTVIGMILDAVLGILKCIGGLLFHSQALFVDGVHSFTDVLSDLVVLIVMKLSRQGPDSNHPYGHQRFETLGTMILGSFLIAIGGALAWDNLWRLISTETLTAPGWPVLVVALVSVAGKEWIFRYTRRVGEKIRSDLIVANAWHSRTDALSSVVVLVGAAGAMAGFHWLDAVAAIVIAVIIAHVGWNFTWSSVRELVDTGLSQEDIRRLKAVAAGTEGVRDVHDLRSRRMGSDILVDIHLVVKAEISVSEGHQVGMQVLRRMRATLPNIRDINFHIDAENDQSGTPTTPELPGRGEIRNYLRTQVPELEAVPHHLRLHYLNNEVHVELFLDQAVVALPATGEIQSRMDGLPGLASVKVWQPRD
ncbi:cation diffusion facilitator family transporter [Marinobacter daqiaonensis]|uniref:Cation diffusion facilitator family transporter n=1 Tax=Marinobacter daqiaonensis TaxID=650891 RepID=A0A1I6GHR3_9GAMM|nr:cation diffusion facilitator family transporter [Marinobacter daqiaonensis]SFR41700.1 cation diffusion facilitator family transporter [Marinobacter daqiaonensis]